MLLLSDVRDYLKTLGIAEHYYIGKLDGKQEKSLGVYQKDQGGYKVALGGLKNKKYEKKSVSLLIHWNKNARETEEQALFIFDKLENIKQVTMGETLVYYVAPQVGEPVDVGTDDNGVYERVIWLDLYHERNRKNENQE
jgi:hypothetical protein